jgi:putative ABC transport system substrate-binding protein
MENQNILTDEGECVIASSIKQRLLLAFAVLLFTGSISWGREPSIDWLEISGDVSEYWETKISPENPSAMNVFPRWEKRNSDVPKKILFIVPKESSSYSFATTEILQVLYSEGIYAGITIVNFDREIDRGLDILKAAERGQVDLILSMGSESADLVNRYYSGGRIPVVTCTNKDPVMLGQVKDYTNGSGTNIAYTSLNIPLDIQKNYLFRLKPNLINIGLLYDRNHAQVMATEVVPTQKAFKELGINVVDIAVTSEETAREELAETIPKAIAKMRKTDPNLDNSVLWVTSSTAVFSNLSTVNQYCGSLPVLSSIPNAVTEGDDSAVIAIGIDRRNNAHLAAIYCVRILKGEAKPGDLPVGIVTPPDVAINFRLAKKIDLKIPLSFFESAAFIYDYDGRLARAFGQKIK